MQKYVRRPRIRSAEFPLCRRILRRRNASRLRQAEAPFRIMSAHKLWDISNIEYHDCSQCTWTVISKACQYPSTPDMSKCDSV